MSVQYDGTEARQSPAKRQAAINTQICIITNRTKAMLHNSFFLWANLHDALPFQPIRQLFKMLLQPEARP